VTIFTPVVKTRRGREGGREDPSIAAPTAGSAGATAAAVVAAVAAAAAAAAAAYAAMSLSIF